MMAMLTELVEDYSRDLSAFADIGTAAPIVEQTRLGFSVSFTRMGDETELQFEEGSHVVIEVFGDTSIKHANFRSLLASDRYGHMRDWALKQRIFLEEFLKADGDGIELSGRFNGGIESVGIQELDQFITLPQRSASSRILLVDGPAGIGKTYFILKLAHDRASNYLTARRPLILHVQSRGRTLSYIYDLIAYSLQRLRLSSTYDQIPVLAKHGLITIAIDGFDELADPDGYDLAWSQVSELIEGLRGAGSIILAGRETFVGRERVIRDIASIRDEDEVSVFTLQAPTKGQAISWLHAKGWTEDQIALIEEFLEPYSLALRPFFLNTLSNPVIASTIRDTSSSSVLAILMDAMIDREVDKFGEAVELELSFDERRQYVRNLLGEVAREMAENSGVSVSDANLSWLVEVALPVKVSDSVVRLLKARSQVLAFLTNDDRPGYRRFFHDKFYEYFLTYVVVDTLSRLEIGKFVSRNILGSSFLETFGIIVMSGIDLERSKLYLSNASKLLQTYPPIDRTRRNLGALLIASLPIADFIENFEISSVDIDEARAVGTASDSSLVEVVISQLDARGADLSGVSFRKCVVLTLIGDEATKLPSSMPIPTRIQDISLGTSLVSKPSDAKDWVHRHLANPPEQEKGLIPSRLRDHLALKLLGKACRRQYWLRTSDDIHSAKILNDDYWSLLERVLGDNNLLRVELRPVSGTDARCLHIRQSDALMGEDASIPDVVRFYGQLVQELDMDSRE